MKGLEGLMGIAELAKQFERTLGPSMAIREMMERQAAWQSQLGIFNMQKAVLKAVGVTDWISNPLKYQVVNRFESVLQKSVIPATLSETLKSINRNYDAIFQHASLISNLPTFHSHPVAQMNNLSFAINGLSSQMAAIAASQKRWDLFDDLNVVSERVAELINALADEVEDKESWSETVKRKWIQLTNNARDVYQKNKEFGTKVYSVINFILMVMSVHQYVDFIKEKPVPATHEDSQTLRKQVEELQQDARELKDLLKEYSNQSAHAVQEEYRITNRKCNVRLKPNNGAYVIADLPKGFYVVMVEDHKKWIYVTFHSPSDNLPQAGWVLKKYLTTGN